MAYALSDMLQDHLPKFLALIDDILNVVLFALIGLEVIAIAGHAQLIPLGVAALPLVILARKLAVGPCLLAMRPKLSLEPMAILVWGGLKDGISVALALSLPESAMRTTILAATYVVVMFAVIIQGGSVGKLIAKLSPS